RGKQPRGAARRSFRRGDRAVSDRPMVRRRQDAGATGDRGGARRAHGVRAETVGGDLLQLDGKHPAWCISRQLFWGHQIPAWYGWALDGDQVSIAKTQTFVAESEAEALAQAREYYQREVVTVANLDESLGLVGFGSDKPPEKFGIWRDQDVLDTWFS